MFVLELGVAGEEYCRCSLAARSHSEHQISTAPKLKLWLMLKVPADRAICHPALISECLLAPRPCSIVHGTAAITK